MIVYDLLKEYSQVLRLAKLAGYAQGDYARDIRVYEDYLTLKGSKKHKVLVLMERYNLSRPTIYRIITNLEAPAL